MFDRHRRARLFSLPFPPLIVALLGILLMSGDLEQIDWVVAAQEASRGVITGAFLASVIAFGLLLAVILLAGNVEPDDVGLDRDQVGRGIGITIMTWAAAQVIGVLPRVVAEDPIASHPAWLHGSAFEIAGNFLSGLTFASVEEVALRGFLLVQLYLILHHDPKDPDQGLGRAVALTVLVGNLVALPRVLPYTATRELIASQALLAGLGLYLSWIFLRTRNLFFTIGVHTLILAPTPVVAGLRGEPDWFFPVVVGAVAAIWVLLWPRRE